MLGQPYSEATDVWGFGCTLYECKFLEHPYSDEGKSTDQVIHDASFFFENIENKLCL